tara:strand:+ start:1807 stop:2634 length:828 start_codon:yes stop_codon:yes gene_type:complete
MKLKKILSNFRKEKKSIIAFNLQNLYQLEAAVLITEELQLPMIIQFSERYLRFLNNKHGIQYIINKFSNKFIYYHLDHCIDLEFIKFCIDSGFDSVMYDGSSFDIEVNIKNTKTIIDYARSSGCLVEGELGKVSGVEDGFGDAGSSYADIKEIKKYVDETQIDLLALGIGNAHGFYNSLDALKTEIIRDASLMLNSNQLFVLHGATGLSDEIINEVIGYGVVKINISTQLKLLYIDLLKSYVSNNNLYNEISFSNFMNTNLSEFFKKLINKYTKK